jgi:uncharacterized protein (TIGR02001 family)
MKKTLISLTLTSLFAATTLLSIQASAVEGLSANVGATSNYLWRGVSQTDNAAAISGGIDYANDAGFYAGTWASNIDFGDDASAELDFYLGFNGQLNKNVSYDVGYIYYAYPDSAQIDPSNEYDFGEVYGSLAYSYFSLSASYGVNNDSGAEFADSSLYVSAGAEFEVADGLTLAFHIGDYSFDDKMVAQDYNDYSVSLSKDSFTFVVSDTDMDNDDMKFVISYSVNIDL